MSNFTYRSSSKLFYGCTAYEKIFVRRLYEDDRKVFLLHVYLFYGGRRRWDPWCASCWAAWLWTPCCAVWALSQSYAALSVRSLLQCVYRTEREHTCRVADPDPQYPYVLGPPGSGSFFRQAKIVRKTLILTVLRLLYDFLSFKKWCKCSFKK